MKKSTFILMAVVLGMTACNDREMINTTGESSIIGQSFNVHGIKSSNSYLSFKDFDSYEKLLNDTENDYAFYKQTQNYGYTSYYQNHSEEVENNEYPNINDKFLAHILSEDLTVEIGEFLFLLEPTSKTVYVSTESLDKSQYQQFIDRDYSDIQVLEFSFDDDIMGILQDEVDSIKYKWGRRKDCKNAKNTTDGWYTYATFKDTQPIYDKKDRTYKFKRKYKQAYETFGFYKRLYSEFCHKESWWGTYDNTHFSLGYTFSYKDKKGNTGSGSLYPTQQWTSWVSSTQTSFYDFIDESKTVNHYRSSRCLHEGKVKTWGFFRRRDNQKLQTFDLGELTI